jgi:hypothetical protein
MSLVKFMITYLWFLFSICRNIEFMKRAIQNQRMFKHIEIFLNAFTPTLKAIHISSRASQRATKTVKEYVFPMP